ncbi:MAG TPA: hypothetical protein VEK34_06770 [Methylocella sp.]|nr:hypothetical protein [Methylocella sp.]
MRAVFSVDLQEVSDWQGEQTTSHKSYPSDEDLIQLFDDFGWGLIDLMRIENRDIMAMVGDRDLNTPESSIRDTSLSPANDLANTSNGAVRHFSSLHLRLADPIFAQMPEVAAAERSRAIYIGYIASEQTLFVVIRMVPSVITLRLLHRELERLQRATTLMIQRLSQASLRGQTLILSPVIRIYERRFDHVIINGWIITNPLREVIREHWVDAIVFAVALSLAIVSLPNFYAGWFSENPIPFGMLERFNTAVSTTALILLIQLCGSYFQFKRTRLINWMVSRREKSY